MMDPDAGFSVLGLRIPVEFVSIPKLVYEVPLVERFGGSWVMLAVSSSIFAGVNFLSIMGIASGFESEDGIAWSCRSHWIGTGFRQFVAIVGIAHDRHNQSVGLHPNGLDVDLFATLHEHHDTDSQGCTQCRDCQRSGQGRLPS